MKTVYEIRQRLFTDGQNIFTESDVLTGFKILNLSQAPQGHPAHIVNSRISKKKQSKKDTTAQVLGA